MAGEDRLVRTEWVPGHRRTITGGSAWGYQHFQTLQTFDANEVFARSSGVYVFVVHGNIAGADSDINTASPNIHVEVMPQKQLASGAFENFAYNWHRHSMRLFARRYGQPFSPTRVNLWGCPFWITTSMTLQAGEKWTLRGIVWAPQDAGAQTTSSGGQPSCTVDIENLSVTAFSIEHLADNGVGWAYQDTETVATLSPTYGVIASEALADRSGEAWACFWSGYCSPGADPSSPVASPAEAACAVRNAGGTITTYQSRGYGRRFPARGAALDYYAIGGVQPHTFTDDQQGFRVVARETVDSGLAIARRANVFAVSLEDSGFSAHHYSSESTGSPVYHEVYGAPGSQDTPGYSLQWVGDATRNRTYIAEVVKPGNDGPPSGFGPPEIRSDGVGWALEPSYLWQDPLFSRAHTTYAMRGILEPTPDYRSGRHTEAVYGNALQIRGHVNQNDIPRTHLNGDSTATIQALVNVVTLPEFYGIVDPGGPSSEVPGPATYVSLRRESLDPGDLPAFPSPPTGVAQGAAIDVSTEIRTLGGDKYTLPALATVRLTYQLTWTWDEKQHPGRLAAWLAFLRGSAVTAASWQSPLDEAPAAYVLDASTADLRGGTRNGVWTFTATAYRLSWTGAP